jgi:hypothetical protein
MGMMAVHLLPSTDPDGSISTAYSIASGRASALFAVLAGVGLALANGGVVPPADRAHTGASAGIAGRALMIGLIGLFLGDLDSGVAVILVNYGFLFLIGAILIGLRFRAAVGLAGVWAVVSPIASHWLRQRIPAGTLDVPGLTELGDPVWFLREIFLTGYYPVFTWIAYLLAGLAVGRLALASNRVAAGLLGAGVGLAVGSRLLSTFLLDGLGGRSVVGELPVQFFGTTPLDSWWYLAVPTPHSGTTFDLLHTTGCAMAVLGGCLLLASIGRSAVAWLAGAGGMTLSLYTSHVLALTAGWGLDDRLTLLIVHAVVALVIGFAWRALVGRGPLETLVAGFSSVIRRAVVPSGLSNPRAG